MNRRDFIGGAAAALAAGCVDANPGARSAADAISLAAAKKWFVEAQYGMMAHWGLYSLLGGEWKGKRMAPQYIAEWIQQYYRIPNAEYAKLAAAFNPVFFDAEEWVKLARDAGMKYLVFTSKHHEGFAMYRSKVSKFNVVDATPFRRDVVGELAEACRKYGLRLGLYYSQDLDWHERNGGGWTLGKTWTGGAAYWTNNWDFPEDDKKDFSEYFESKCKPQVKEILTQYGDLCLIWFDIGATLSADQSVELYDMVRKYQPGCLINGRLGYGLGDYETPGDNMIADTTAAGKLYETVGTMNDSWGYRPTDTHYKSVKDILAIKAKCASIGSNYMLNVGPDPLGRFPVAAVEILDGLAKA